MLAWIGGSNSGSVYYYRIHSPVILIEFDHQRPANLSRFAEDVWDAVHEQGVVRYSGLPNKAIRVAIPSG